MTCNIRQEEFCGDNGAELKQDTDVQKKKKKTKKHLSMLLLLTGSQQLPVWCSRELSYWLTVLTSLNNMVLSATVTTIWT